MDLVMRGKFILEAPIQQVWSFLLESGTLASCIPGAEKIEVIDEKTYKGVVKQKIGPISARFEFTANLTEMNPPRYLKVVGRSSDKMVGTSAQEIIVNITEISNAKAEISYDIKVNMFGSIPVIGKMMMEAKAKTLEKQFTENLQDKLREKLGNRKAKTNEKQ